MISTLNYPVALVNNGDVAGYSSPETLQICAEIAIDEHLMLGAHIIDSQGQHCTIKAVKKVKNLNWLPGILVKYKNRIVEVSYELEAKEELTLGEFKTLVLDTLKSGPYKNDASLLKSVRGSESHFEVIESTGIN